MDAHAHRSKGNGDTATWLPPYTPFRCTYVARQVAVKGKYDLWVTAAEADSMTRVVATSDHGFARARLCIDCGEIIRNQPNRAAPIQPAPALAPPAGGVSYRNCTAV